MKKRIILLIFCIVSLSLVIIQLRLNILKEDEAKKIGIFDRQSKRLNEEFISNEEKIAIYRSSLYLINSKRKEFTDTPKDIIYIDPLNDVKLLSSKQ